MNTIINAIFNPLRDDFKPANLELDNLESNTTIADSENDDSQIIASQIIVSPDRYDSTKKVKLGEGSYGKVFVENENEAIKIFKNNNDDDDVIESYHSFEPCMLREIDISIKMGNAKIAPLVNKIYCDDQIGFSMDLCTCSLDDLWKPENDRKINYDSILNNLDSLIFQIVYGLAYAQHHKIIHRDIKPPNIFIKTEQILDHNDIYNKFGCEGYKAYIGDWGLASIRTDSPFCDNDKEVQTIWYRCPEQLLNVDKYKNNVTIDMWSIGIIMLELLRRKRALVGENQEKMAIFKIIYLFGIPKDDELLRAMDNNKIKYPEKIHTDFIKTLCELANAPIFCESFISCCLKLSPLERINPIDALKHPFLYHFIEDKQDIEWIINSNDPFNHFLTYANLDSYDCISSHKIMTKNPQYLGSDYHNNPKKTGRMSFLYLYGNLTASLQMYSMCVDYTDKMMEQVKFEFTFDSNFGLAIYSLAHGSLVDYAPIINKIKDIFQRKLFLHIDENEVARYMRLIVKTFKYKLPLKTIITYQFLIDTSEEYITIAYRDCSKKVIDGFYNADLTVEQTLKMIYGVLENYQFKTTLSVVNFGNSLQKLKLNLDKYENLIRNKNMSVKSPPVSLCDNKFKYSKTIDYSGGIICEIK